MHPDSFHDYLLVALGIAALIGVPVLLARQDRISLFFADRYLTAARHGPSWLPRVSESAPTPREFVLLVRMLARIARLAAVALSLVAALLLLAGADALD